MSESESAINEAQQLANTPTDVTQLYPHERMLLQTIGSVGQLAQLRDIELVSGLERVLNYLKYYLSQAKKDQTGGETV